MNAVLIAFLLSTVAGLSTGFGSAIPFFFKSFKEVYLAFFLGLSAGVMILVSFAELLPIAMESIGHLWAFLAFFIGMAVVILIDFLIPHQQNPHHMTRDKEAISSIQTSCQEGTIASGNRMEQLEQTDSLEKEQKDALTRMGILTAIAIAIHNFPEGIATFATALEDLSLGLSITIAIAIHNIPEGISVSIPIYYSTDSKWKSFGLSVASGLAEPLGAAFAYAVFFKFLNPSILAASLAFVAGIMVYISIDELIPVAHEYGKGDVVMAGIVSGMVIMAASLLLFALFS
ncbi:MAG: zinc transporter ZupT [Candidatus Heimdallarchaeota archaeon]|nr:zinc transporter ZupT [Candidatus Heimdallarchaeota archaeon]